MNDRQHQHQSAECKHSLSYRNILSLILKIRVLLTFLFLHSNKEEFLLIHGMMLQISSYR